MRIAIINLTGGGMSGGYRKYLLNIIPRMASHCDVDAILCASPTSVNVHEWFEQLPNVKFVNCRPYRLFGFDTDSELILQLKEFSPDVIFVPTERLFRFECVPVVNMLQNMGPFVANIYGGRFNERIKNWIHSLDSKRSIKKSDHVIAISKFVRDFMEYNCRIPNNKIGLIYHGVDLQHKDSHRPDIIPRSWDGRFLFTAGSIIKYRGLEDAFYALNHLGNKLSDTTRLVIAGENSPGMRNYRRNIEDWIKSHNLSSRVCWAGNLNETEMAWCYQNCAVFIMTSRVEACPNIALEAMSHGCISISSDNPPLPEIFGDAAIYYPAHDDKALAGELLRVLTWDGRQRNELSERAKKRAAQFSWDFTAERTVSELAKAIESFRLENK